jgi:hypothetical protein
MRRKIFNFFPAFPVPATFLCSLVEFMLRASIIEGDIFTDPWCGLITHYFAVANLMYLCRLLVAPRS